MGDFCCLGALTGMITLVTGTLFDDFSAAELGITVETVVVVGTGVTTDRFLLSLSVTCLLENVAVDEITTEGAATRVCFDAVAASTDVTGATTTDALMIGLAVVVVGQGDTTVGFALTEFVIGTAVAETVG